MTKAERVMRYTKIEPEAAIENEATKPPADWPSKGRIVFDHVTFAYSSDSPAVLKDVSCDIRPGEKVGHVILLIA
jgi:ABC-type multidrug transport system fused ATPase/permease subunit